MDVRGHVAEPFTRVGDFRRRDDGGVGRKLTPGVVAGVALWGVLTVACSSAVDAPAPGGATWGGTIEGPGDPEPKGPPLAISWDKRSGTDTLYRVHPRTMKLREPVPLRGRGTMATDVSSDGQLLIATAKDGIRVVDVRRPDEVHEAQVDVRWVREAAWAGDDAAILVVDRPGATLLLRIEVSTGTVLDRASVPGQSFATADAGDGIVVLTSPYTPEAPAEPRPANLAVMDAAGEFATVRLDAIGAGFHDEDYLRDLPALATRGSVATVVGTDGTIVSVDLDTLDVTVEGEDDSLFDALASWFVPPAHAKSFDGTELRAEWAGPHALLVSGYRTEHPETTAVGALLLDPDDWSATVVDPDAYYARVAGEHLLTWKGLMIGDDRGDGIGLRAYAPDGELEWHVFERQFVRPVAVHRGIAYVEHGWDRVLVSSVDLETGEILATRESYVNVLSL